MSKYKATIRRFNSDISQLTINARDMDDARKRLSSRCNISNLKVDRCDAQTKGETLLSLVAKNPEPNASTNRNIESIEIELIEKTAPYYVVLEHEVKELNAKTLQGAKREASLNLAFGVGDVAIHHGDKPECVREFWSKEVGFGWHQWKPL